MWQIGAQVDGMLRNVSWGLSKQKTKLMRECAAAFFSFGLPLFSSECTAG